MTNYLPNIYLPNLASWAADTIKKESVQKGLFLTGLAVASWNLLYYTSKVVSYVSAREYNLISRYGVDSWALVTGASDGLGREFAFQLAHRGFNLILVARNEDKLGVIRAEITTKHPNVRVRIIVADFSKSAVEGFYENIREQVNDLDISLLVNNVGQYIVNDYHLIPTSDIRDLVLVNCLAQALMTRVFLPKLLSRCDGKVKSGIIDVSSASGPHPMAYSQLYSSTKDFNDYLSQGLSYEYPQLDIISLQPAYTKSNMTKMNGKFKEAISAEDFVNAGLRYLGHTRHSFGHWKHQIFSYSMEAIPTFIVNRKATELEGGSAEYIRNHAKKLVISEKF